MYVSRTILLVLFGMLILPPLVTQLAMRLSYGWLMPAGLWALIILCCFWIMRLEHRTHG